MHHSGVPRTDRAGRWRSRDGSVWTDSIGFDQLDWVAKEAIRASSIKRWLESIASRSAPKTRTRGRVNTHRQTSAAVPETVPEKPKRDSVFISYARADQKRVKWVDRLILHLRQIPDLLPRVWNDSRIEAGADWLKEIEYGLASAKAAVMLVGPNFLTSRFVLEKEVPSLLKVAKENGVRIFPLITDPSAYEESILGQYQSFNDTKKYLSRLSAPQQNEMLLALAREVAKVFQQSP